MSESSLSSGSPKVVLQVEDSFGLLQGGSTPTTACITPLTESDLIASIKASVGEICRQPESDGGVSVLLLPLNQAIASPALPQVLSRTLTNLTPGQHYLVFIAGVDGAGVSAATCHLPPTTPRAVVKVKVQEENGDCSEAKITVTPDLSQQLELVLMQAVEAQMEVERLQQLQSEVEEEQKEQGKDGSPETNPLNASSTVSSSKTTVHRFTEAVQAEPGFANTIQNRLEAQVAAMKEQLQNQTDEMNELRGLLQKTEQKSSGTKPGTLTEFAQHHFKLSSPVANSAPSLTSNPASPSLGSSTWVEVE